MEKKSSLRTAIHLNQGTNHGTIHCYQNSTVYQGSSPQATASLVKLSLSQFNLKPFECNQPITLSSVLNRYFTPLQSYEHIASWLYGANTAEQTGRVEYPLWQVRQAYLATTQWYQTLDEMLETLTCSSQTAKSDDNASQTVELAIAKVLKHTLTHPKESLQGYSGDREPLDTLIQCITQTDSQQPVDHLIYALSLIITLSLRDTTAHSEPCQQMLSLLKGQSIKLRLHTRHSIHLTTELKLTPSQVLRELMFIDFRYTCWSGLDLEGISFSGTDFTGALFIGSRNLGEARYSCFHQINAQGLIFREKADCTGTDWRRAQLRDTAGNQINFSWGYFSRAHLDKRQLIASVFENCYFDQTGSYQAFYRTLDDIIAKCSLTIANYAEEALGHQERQRARHYAQWGLTQVYLKHRHKALEHFDNAIKEFILPSRLPWLLHLFSLHSKLGHYDKALAWLLVAWNLNNDTVTRIVQHHTQVTQQYLMMSKESLSKDLATLKDIHHQQFYTRLSNASSHTDDNPDKTNNARCVNYLNFVKALWLKDPELYNTLLNIPNTVGYRQSERIAYETLAASIQRLCLTVQSDDERLLNTQTINEKVLPEIQIASISIDSKSVSEQYLQPRMVQQLIQYKLLDIKTGEFKLTQESNTTQKTNMIKSQHRVIRIDYDSQKVYLSSEPEVPHKTHSLNSDGISVYLKIHPDLPMMDYTTDIFNRRLIGHGSPANTLAVLTITSKTTQGKSSFYQKRYPVLISQTVEGVNLHTVLANHQIELLERLENKSTSEFFIAEVLKHPGDGFSRNYVLAPQLSNTTQIVSVDNSQMFVEPIVHMESMWGHKKNLLERSIIYCLPQVMRVPLSPRALSTITNIHHVTKLLTAWLKTVAAQEENYTQLMTEDDIALWNSRRDRDNPFIRRALFRTGAVSLLAMQLRYLQSLFHSRQSQQESIMPSLVIEKLNPRLLHYYQAIGKQALASEDAFKQATGAVQSMSSSQATRAILGEVPDGADIQQQLNQLRETAKTNSFVQQTLDELNYLGVQLLADLKNKQAFNITDEGDWELRVDFQPPKNTSTKKFLSVKKTQKNEAEANNNSDENKAQLVTAKLQQTVFEQEKWLETFLVKKATFKALVLSHCLGLDDARFIGLIRDSQHLEYLDITGCQKITEKSLHTLANHCKELRTLKASRTGIIDATRKISIFQPDRLLHFPKLHTLHLRNSARIEMNNTLTPLTRLALNAPELNTLKLSCNSGLISVDVSQSNQLNHLNLEKATQLTQLKLSAEAQLTTVNLTGCKQLPETQLTFNSRLLFSAHLTGCDNLMYRNFRQAYPTFLTALPWHHYSKSFVEKLSAILENMLLVDGKTIPWGDLPTLTRGALHDTLHAWGKLGQDIIPVLLKASRGNHSDVRQAATQALGQCAEHNLNSIIPVLTNVLKDKEWWVRQAATKALGQCAKHNPSSIIPTLLSALKDNDSYVRQAATEALGQCAEHDLNSIIPELLNALKEHKHYDSWRVRQAAAHALGKCAGHLGSHYETIIPVLLKASKDNHSDVCQAAAQTLSRCTEHHPSSITPELTSALRGDKHDDSWKVRKTTTHTLGKCTGYDSSSTITKLLSTLKDKEWWARRTAAQDLGTIGSVDTLQSWIKNVFNQNKANLESESTLEQQPPPHHATPYSSVVITQQTSSPPTELPTLHSHSHNKSAKREEHEETYSNKEI